MQKLFHEILYRYSKFRGKAWAFVYELQLLRYDLNIYCIYEAVRGYKSQHRLSASPFPVSLRSASEHRGPKTCFIFTLKPAIAGYK